MTFEKPTFVKPDSATVDNLNYSDIYIGGHKIGSIMKTKGRYYLDVCYSKHEFNEKEKGRIISVINMEYSKYVLHVLANIKKADIDKWKELMSSEKEKRKLKPHNNMKVSE